MQKVAMMASMVLLTVMPFFLEIALPVELAAIISDALLPGQPEERFEPDLDSLALRPGARLFHDPLHKVVVNHYVGSHDTSRCV